MRLPKAARTIAKMPLRAILQQQSIRRRIIFELKQDYYNELEIRVPLGFGLNCPVSFPEAWSSFVEMFVMEEYAAAFESMPLPGRWLDLGCHAGFFSLYVAWLRAKTELSQDFNALLIDGDKRVEKQVRDLLALNGLEDRVLFQHGLISRLEGRQEFIERSHMSSSLCRDGLPAGTSRIVETVTADQIMSLLPPPYDLVKVDLEGGEYDFLTAYGPVLESTGSLLLEWHSWHAGGGGPDQIQEMALAYNFQLSAHVIPAHNVTDAPTPEQCGIFLFRKVARN